MQKILLYYKFAPLADPEVIRLWQKTLCEKLNLRGRILVSKHGLNGTIGGELDDLKAYVRAMKEYVPFKTTQFKWSDGAREDFPRLSVKLRDEVVAFNAGDELQVNEQGVVGGGTHLTPAAVHDLVAARGEDVVFFDGRNAHEAAIGKFKKAVVPNTRTSRDFVRELDSGRYDHLKTKPVVTYCTGGVRCEVLSVLMKNRGWQEVYQIDGGIAKYGETFGDDGLWEGTMYVFDKRMGVKFSDRAVNIGRCIHCKTATSNYENCHKPACNKLVLICSACYESEQSKEFCSDKCRSIAAR